MLIDDFFKMQADMTKRMMEEMQSMQHRVIETGMREAEESLMTDTEKITEIKRLQGLLKEEEKRVKKDIKKKEDEAKKKR